MRFSFAESALSTLLNDNEPRNMTTIEDSINSLCYVFTDQFRDDQLKTFTRIALQTSIALYKRLGADGIITKSIEQRNIDEQNPQDFMSRFYEIIKFAAEELVITDVSIKKAYETVYTKPAIRNKKIDEFSSEYKAFFDVYYLLERVYENTKEDYKLTIFPALLEFHQGLTHLSRSFNFQDSGQKEISRFKSHIRRATLDIAKITIEQLSINFQAEEKSNMAKDLKREAMLIKAYEVASIPSDQMETLISKYKECINKFILK